MAGPNLSFGKDRYPSAAPPYARVSRGPSRAIVRLDEGGVPSEGGPAVQVAAFRP